MLIVLILAVIYYVANTIDTNTRINIINKMMSANVSTKINTSIASVVINSCSTNNTNSSNNINNMMINTIIVDVDIMSINLLV